MAVSKTLYPNNPQRLTPYPNFRFVVVSLTDGNKPIAGIARVSGLTRGTQVMHYREGGDPSTVHKAPGQTDYGSISLERGVSFDPAFEQWANKVFDYTNSQSSLGQNTSLLNYRKDLLIQVFNEAGVKVMEYMVHQAWVSHYNAMSELDANGEATFVIESITLEHEGWERNNTVASTKEPSFTDPEGTTIGN